MQPKLFEKPSGTVAVEDVLLYALGDFQSRGKVLANRELAFDRLRGAFLRAFIIFGIAELSDEIIVKGLRGMGATVTELPRFVAKRPYRILIDGMLSSRAAESWANKQL